MRSENSKNAYRTAYSKYFVFTGGLTASRLVDEAELDDNSPARMKKDVVVQDS